MALKRTIVARVDTYLENPDGSRGQLCDWSENGSCGLDTAEVIDMRRPLLDVVKAWNEGDQDTVDVVVAPAAPNAAKG